MNVHISYKVSKSAGLERQINQEIAKLNRLLQVFRPDLVHLKGILEESNTAGTGFTCSLNLRLPSGQLAAQESSATVDMAVRTGFDALTAQLKKHKALLRDHHRAQRRRSPGREAASMVPFEQTLAAVKPAIISSSDVTDYLDVNLPRLKRFIARELEYRESQGQLQSNQVAVDDVVGEAISNALSENHDKPERMKLEPWLYRLSREAIGSLSADGDGAAHVALERKHGGGVRETDDPVMQYQRPERRIYDEDTVIDDNGTNPEELAARREVIDLVQNALRQAGRSEREAFILYTIEGFTLEEISDITGRNVSETRAAIGKAREHLQRVLPIKDALKEKLIEYSKSA